MRQRVFIPHNAQASPFCEMPHAVLNDRLFAAQDAKVYGIRLRWQLLDQRSADSAYERCVQIREVVRDNAARPFKRERNRLQIPGDAELVRRIRPENIDVWNELVYLFEIGNKLAKRDFAGCRM